MDRISPNFKYAFILTISTLALLHIIFRTFVPVLWPLIYVKMLFPFNILRTDGQNFTKFYICSHIDMIYVGIVTHHFSHTCTRVIDLSQHLVSVNILRTNRPNFTKLYLTIYTDNIYVGFVSCHFRKFVRELWPLIDVRITLPFNILRNSGLLLHAKHCSRAIVRISDNSSLK